jgi:hypothetical protein
MMLFSCFCCSLQLRLLLFKAASPASLQLLSMISKILLLLLLLLFLVFTFAPVHTISFLF